MADKDARVRLNLSNAGFLSAMQQADRETKAFTRDVEAIGGAAERSSRKTSGFLSAVKAGAGGARSELTALGSKISGLVGMAATLGGALSIGGAMHGAMQATSAYKDLAFSIRVGTGEAMSWQDVQKDVEEGAGRWKRSNQEVRESYAGLFAETGNKDFAKAGFESAARAADATGKSMSTWSDIAGTLNEKFGIGASGIDDAMAAAIELTNKGGASAEELASKLGIVGASAKMLGMTGTAGFKSVLGMINMADDSLGTTKQKFGAVTNVLDQMADPERLKQIEKALGVKLTDSKGGVRGDALQRILAKTQGDEGQLRKAFGATEVKLVASMAKPFVEAFAAAKGTVQQRTAAALDAYTKALEAASKTTYDGAALAKDATARLNEAPRNMAQALNDFEKVFERPEMVKAVDAAAAMAPKLAGLFGNLLSFAAEHPILAAGAVAGGAAAKGAITGVAKDLGERAMSASGKAIAEAFTKSVEKSGAWGTAGKALGVAAAAVVAYEIGKHAIDQLYEKRGKEATDLVTAGTEADLAATSNDPARKAAAAAALRQQIEAAEKDKPGFFEQAFAVGANMVDSSVDVDERENALARARAKLQRLEGGAPTLPAVAAALPPAATPGGASRPSADAEKIAREVTNGGGGKINEQSMAQTLAAATARQLGNVTLRVQVVGGGDGTNGLSPAPGNGSGSTPRG